MVFKNRLKKPCPFQLIHDKLLLKKRKTHFRIRIKMFLRASELKVVGTILMETRKIKSTLKKKN